MTLGDRSENHPLAPPDPLADVNWVDVHRRALIAAAAYVPEQDIDDVVNEGMARVLEGSAPWDPTTGQTLPDHIVRIGANARRVEVRKLDRRASGPFVAEVGDAIAASAPPDPETSAVEADRRARLFHRILTHFAGDPDALEVVRCEDREIILPAEQALASGLSIEAVRNARKRIKRALETLLQGEEP
jgi:DNA-directed RNA polymerase specialized sigma24 family protein